MLWATLVAAGIDAGQLPPAQIKAFALSRGIRAKTDRIDAEMIARFMLFRPETGRGLPSENLRILRALTTRRAQIVDMRKRFSAQIAARRKQDIPADADGMDADLRAMLDTHISDLERRIESVIAKEKNLGCKGPAYAFHPRDWPCLSGHADRGNAGTRPDDIRRGRSHERLAPVPHDSGAMRGRRAIAGGRRALRHVLFQAALAAACHNPVLKPVAQRLKMRGKPHKLVIVAIARRLVTIANAILKTGVPWQQNPVM